MLPNHVSAWRSVFVAPRLSDWQRWSWPCRLYRPLGLYTAPMPNGVVSGTAFSQPKCAVPPVTLRLASFVAGASRWNSPLSE